MRKGCHLLISGNQSHMHLDTNGTASEAVQTPECRVIDGMSPLCHLAVMTLFRARVYGFSICPGTCHQGLDPDIKFLGNPYVVHLCIQ